MRLENDFAIEVLNKLNDLVTILRLKKKLLKLLNKIATIALI